jgi:hypothetical protein
MRATIPQSENIFPQSRSWVDDLMSTNSIEIIEFEALVMPPGAIPPIVDPRFLMECSLPRVTNG